jgi:hypothetical protein
MPDYTPGPWIKSGHTVRDIHGTVIGETFGADAPSNALVMAAGPELVEALEAIVFAARIDGPGTVAWINLLRACDAKIAKAKGEGVGGD